VRTFDLPNLTHGPHAILLLVNIILSAPQNPVPAIAGLLPASIDAPLWENMDSLLGMIKGIIDKPPDQFPIFTMQHPSNPAVFARVVDPPSQSSDLPDQALVEAEELQGAGIYNTMGFIVVIVAVFEMGEADESNAGLYDAVQLASQMLDTGFQVAPELVILGLEKLNVS
jgi:CCR4-NOT transcription complex subunit 1